MLETLRFANKAHKREHLFPELGTDTFIFFLIYFFVLCSVILFRSFFL